MPFLYQTLYNFRNLKNDTIDLSNREVYFVGENGQGKSNILESLYYSSYAVSFRTHTESQIIKKNQKNFSINSIYKKNDEIQKVSIIYDEGKKRIEKNGKKIVDRKELINTIPCILFCHDDMRFATGEPENRRFFIDQSLTLYDSLYTTIPHLATTPKPIQNLWLLPPYATLRKQNGGFLLPVAMESTARPYGCEAPFLQERAWRNPARKRSKYFAEPCGLH